MDGWMDRYMYRQMIAQHGMQGLPTVSLCSPLPPPVYRFIPLYLSVPPASPCIQFYTTVSLFPASTCIQIYTTVSLCSNCIQLYAPLPLSPSVSLSFPLYPPLSLCLPLYPSVSACIPFKHYYKTMIAGACDSKCSISGYQLHSIYEKVRLNLSNVDIFLTFCHVTRIYS